MNPIGVALLFCRAITSDADEEQEAVAKRASCARTIDHTIDTIIADDLPNTLGPYAVYVLLSGSDRVDFSLAWVAPSGEILLVFHHVADAWGTLGMHEFVVRNVQIPLTEPGIYSWELMCDYDAFLRRPILVKKRT